MRKIFILLAVAVSAVMCFASCTKEQSEINPDSIPGKATITGTFFYSSGQSYSPASGFSEEIVPAAGVNVYVDVDNSGFKEGAEGYTTYETVTDETGTYSVTIPATASGVSISVRADDFVAEATVVDGQENGSPVFRTGEAIYRLDGYDKDGIKPGKIVEYSAMFDYEFFTEPVSFAYSGDVNFRVGFNAFSSSDQAIFAYADERVDLIVKAKYSGEGYSMTRTYGVTAIGGEATLTIPLVEETCQLSMTVEALRTEGIFYDEDNERYSGTYAQYNYSSRSYGPQSESVNFDKFDPETVDVAMLFSGSGYESSPYNWRYAFDEEWD